MTYSKGDRVQVLSDYDAKGRPCDRQWRTGTVTGTSVAGWIAVDRDDGCTLGTSEWSESHVRPLKGPPLFLSTDSADRKLMPVATGCMAYFPDALMCVSFVSLNGANKHCNGVLGWDKAKSADEKDAEARHMLDALRGLPPDPGLERLGDLGHLASKAWRALADLQRACDAEREKFK